MNNMKKITLVTLMLGGIQALTAQQSIDAYLSGSPTYVTIATSANKVALPRDLDFKPDATGQMTYELWVVNNGTSSSVGSGTVLIFNAGKPNQFTRYKKDSNASHFIRMCPAIAFGTTDYDGKPGGNVLWANAEEGNNGGDNFTGASLWPSDTLIYAKIHQNDNLLGSHCDMLHQSPYSMGIAHEKANAYWLFDGNKANKNSTTDLTGNIVRYDFAIPHGYGADDHSDGRILRYTQVKVLRKAGVPSHLILDKETGWLYIADTGNKRIVRMDIKSGTVYGKLTATNEPLASYQEMRGEKQEDFVRPGTLTEPCGIDFYQGRLIVSDHATGDIVIYDATVSPGIEKGRIKTGSTGLMGVKVGPDGKIWYVDNVANKVVRIDPAGPNSIGEETNKFNFSVFPNPATEAFHVSYTLEKTQLATVNILDIQGRVIDVISVEGNKGVNQIELNNKNYPAGIYLIKLTVGNESYFKKLSIL